MKDISEYELKILDEFEEGYDRTTVEVMNMSTKEKFYTFTYVWAGDTQILHGSWEFEEFLPYIESFLASEVRK